MQARIKALSDASYQQLWTNPRNALRLSEEALQHWQTIQADAIAASLHADVLTNLAEAYYQLAEYDSTLLHIPQALDLYKEIGDSPGEIRAMSIIGATLAALGTYSDALDWLFRAVQQAQDTRAYHHEAAALNYLVMIYVRLHDLETALHYLQDALLLLETHGDDPTQRGMLLDNMTDVMMAGEQYDEAMQYTEESLALHRQTGYIAGECRALIASGRVYNAREDYATALVVFQQCLELADTNKIYPQQIESRLYVVEVYSALNRTVGLLTHLQEALTLAEKIQSRDLMMRSHEMLAKIYKQSKNYESALQHHEIYQHLYGQVNNQEADKHRKNLQIAYQVDAARKETEVYQLRNEQLQREIGRRKRAESRVSTRLQNSMVVLQVFDEMNSTLDFEQAALLALDAAQRLSAAAGGFVALVEIPDTEDAVTEGESSSREDTKALTMRIRNTLGQYTSDDLNRTFVLDERLVTRLFDERQPLRLDDAKTDLPALEKMSTRVLIPLIARERFIGLVNLETDKPERFHDDVLHLLQLMQHYMALGLDNARLHDQVGTQLGELRHLYDEVSRLEQLKTDMIRIAAHDLKNPVAIIKGYAHLIRMYGDAGDKAKQNNALDMVDKGVNRMTTMIDNILSLERIEQMASTGMKEVIDLTWLVKHVFANYRAMAEKTHLYKLTVLDTVPSITGDRAQLEEAISNLVNNAIKYTPAGGTISVALKKERDTIVFEVEDTGYGIPEEDQEQLFQPFYRVKTDETQDIEGTGLGLHLVKNIIERHNGQMTFQSVYGTGSTFGFTIKPIDDA